MKMQPSKQKTPSCGYFIFPRGMKEAQQKAFIEKFHEEYKDEYLKEMKIGAVQ